MLRLRARQPDCICWHCFTCAVKACPKTSLRAWNSLNPQLIEVLKPLKPILHTLCSTVSEPALIQQKLFTGCVWLLLKAMSKVLWKQPASCATVRANPSIPKTNRLSTKALPYPRRIRTKQYSIRTIGKRKNISLRPPKQVSQKLSMSSLSCFGAER